MSNRSSPVDLVQAFLIDLPIAWRKLGMEPKATPYAFVLYGNEGRARFAPVVLTEEGLTRVAERYVQNGYHDTLDEARHALRYSTADSPTFQESAALGLPTVDAMFAPSADALGERDAYRVLANAAMEALSQLDRGGLFGSGAARDRLLLIIITEGTEDDWSKPSAKTLNPPDVYARYEAHFPKIEGTFASPRAIAISSDGRSLYCVATRRIAGAQAGQERVTELIASNIAGPAFQRRWSLEFPNWKQSGTVGLKTDATEDNVYMLRRSESQTSIIGLEGATQKLIAQTVVTGDPKALAVSRNGSRIAALMFNGLVHLLDTDLKLIGSHRYESAIEDAAFLESGALLLATPDEMLLTGADGAIIDRWTVGSASISMDANQTMLALSHSFPSFGSNEPETPARLFRWPQMELIDEIIVPGFHASQATLSPDGKHIALHISPTGKGSNRLAVFDSNTGKEVVRRKTSVLQQIAFRDSRTLLLSHGHYCTNVPVEQWQWGPDSA